jgi:hypothetical protein
MGLTDSPPKIKTIRIVENPFDDIVPRITAAEKREQMKAKLEAKVEMEKRDKRSKAKKWVYLFFSLSILSLLALFLSSFARGNQGDEGSGEIGESTRE